MKIGTILTAEEIPGSDKLIKLTVDLGEEAPRPILSGIKQWYRPEDLVGKQACFVTNLAPRTMMGLESQGMIMALGDENPILLVPASPTPPGAKVR